MAGKAKAPIKIIGERDIELFLGNRNHYDHIVKVGKPSPPPSVWRS